MAGLLDLLNSEQGLLGMSLLAAAAPKERRTSFGEGLLQATQNVQAMRNAQEDRALKKRMMDMQLAGMEAQAQERKRLQEMEQRRGQYLGALDANQGPPMQPTAAGALAAGLSPQEYGMVAPQQAQAPQYKVVGGSLVKIGPDGVSEAYRAPEKADLNSLIVPGPDGKPTLNTLLLDAKRQIARDGAANVGVSYGAPVAGVDAKGNPIFFQPDKAGGAPAIIPGVAPPKRDAALTESQAKAATFMSQMQAAERELAGIPIDMTKLGSQVEVGLAGGITNLAASPVAQRARQAQEQWAESFLRFKTGAAATKDEVTQNVRTFFPQPGDSAAVIEQKKRARAQAAQDIAFAAGQKTQPTMPADPASTPGRVVDFKDLK